MGQNETADVGWLKQKGNEVGRKLSLAITALGALCSSQTLWADSVSVIVVFGTVHARPDRVAELKSLLEEQVGRSRADDGCLRYELSESPSDPTLFMTVEQWKSEDALNAHLSSPRIQSFLKAVTEEGLIEGTPSLQITNLLM